jgi:hypothetical protein
MMSQKITSMTPHFNEESQLLKVRSASNIAKSKVSRLHPDFSARAVFRRRGPPQKRDRQGIHFPL